MRYLLETNIVSDLIRNLQGRIMRDISKIGEAQVCTSIVVAAELRYGAAKRGSRRLTMQLEAVLGAIEVWPRGNDLLLAAQAVTLYGPTRDNALQ